MFLHHFIFFATIGVVFINFQEVVTLSNVIFDSSNTPIEVVDANVLSMENNKFTVQSKKPTLKIYYESRDYLCLLFWIELKDVVELLNQYVDIHTYPYGNAKTNKDKNGTVEVTCPHGPEECYGNKLHGCALDIIANSTEALLFNTCMFALSSDDNSADMCGEIMKIKVDSIKDCAKGKKGTDLLVYYGEESKKVGFKEVPYILLNGVEWNGSNLFNDVCAAIEHPPEPCLQNS